MTDFFRQYFYLFCSVIFACLISQNALAQHSSKLYSFINYDLNHLYYSADSSAYLRFFDKLDSLKVKEGGQKITVVHMGGSHVQGGMWSGTFISNFQNVYATTGGGYFAFPYKMAKTNSQPYLTSFTNGNWKLCRAVGKEFCLPLGMSALSAISNDTMNIFGVNTTMHSSCKLFNTIKVYHNFNRSFEFCFLKKDSTRIYGENHPEGGYSLFKSDSLINSATFEVKRCDTLNRDFILYGLSVENTSSSGFYLAGLGANGAATNSFLRCEFLIPQLNSLSADIFILSLGVNDTQSKSFTKDDFISHYDSLITYIKIASPNAAILLTTTTDNYIKRKTPNKRSIVAREAMFDLMEKHHLAIWDIFSIMGGYRSMTKWYSAGLASSDRVHFTNRGYVILGNLMYDALLKSYNYNRPKNK